MTWLWCVVALCAIGAAYDLVRRWLDNEEELVDVKQDVRAVSRASEDIQGQLDTLTNTVASLNNRVQMQVRR
jgi:hypothetical protein